MYLQIKTINKVTKHYGFDSIITLIWLYKEDDSFVKWIKHAPNIIDKIIETKIDIAITELEWLLNEQEIDKLLPPSTSKLWEVSLFPTN